MNDSEEFKLWGYRIVDRIADYYQNIEKYPVKSQVKPGEIVAKLPAYAPDTKESMEAIMDDFEQLIMPGITHWQSPKFFAYFPANTSIPSILAEILTAGLGTQCMKWDTSPAAAELEERVMEWLQHITGIPENFHGVIQDSATSSTLCAILSAREKYSGFSVNEIGFSQTNTFRVYCSTEAHSSIEKDVKIAGIGRQNLIKISVDESFRMKPEALEKNITDDIRRGYLPLCVIAALGTTGCTSVDPLKSIAEICRKYDIWLHVDAAFAGSALILPEYRWMIDGIEKIDSMVFNPHKWLFTNFDCSAYFVRDKETLIRTFAILPEYLKTSTQGMVNDYCDWGIPLGRRFRALKLWFVLRFYGVQELQQKLRDQIDLASWLEKQIRNNSNFEMLAPRTMNLLCFRYHPEKEMPEEGINNLNRNLLEEINKSGHIYLSHTKLNGKYTIRLVVAQTNVKKRHVEEAWRVIVETAGKILPE